MRATLFLVTTLIASAVSSSSASCTDAYAEYSVMNATSGRIRVDIDASSNHDWRDMPLLPSQSAAFDGALTHLKVCLKSGRVLVYGNHEITAIRTRTHLQKGDWLVDHSGLRFVSCEERQNIFEAAKKYEWPKP